MKRLFRFFVPVLILQVFTSFAVAQSSFTLESKKGFYKQKFDLVNDLVMVPVEVNGVELLFLLDTGINSTIIFSLEQKDSLEVKNATTIYLRGLGAGKPIRAFKSTGNTIKLGAAIVMDETIYIVAEEGMGLANRLGVAVHGIMGYDFFKNFVVEFNYKRKFMKIYLPEKYRYSTCLRCTDFLLNFRKNKPFITAVVEFEEQSMPVDLLLDSGSGDALWLFRNENIIIPKNSFEDFLGFGISGSVYGERSRVKSLSLGNYTFKQVTASFPDTLYINGILTYEERNGSLGGQVLKRFHWVLDYPGKNLRLKPNSNFRNSFEYNMSGVVVEHKGYHLVKDLDDPPSIFSLEENQFRGVEVFRSSYQVKFSLEPRYQVAEVRPGSPAEKAGLKPGDILLELNRRPVHKFSLAEISKIFTSREGRKIKLRVKRGLTEVMVNFKLKRIL